MATIVDFARARREGATPASTISVAEWHEEQGRRDKSRRAHHSNVARQLRGLADQLAA